MTISYTNFFAPVQLGVAATTLYTVPALPTSLLLRGARVRFANTTANPRTVTLYAVPPAGAAADGNAFLKNYTIAANGGFLDIDVPIMPAGSILQGLADAAASITAHMLSGALTA